MSIRIQHAGLQTTIQANPRRGQRHHGVPLCGAADPVSLALANRVLENEVFAAGLEATLGGVSFVAGTSVSIAVTGAQASCSINGIDFPMYVATTVAAGEAVKIAPPIAGARTYIGIRGGLCADEFLGSSSTYLPAAFGGLAGRALQKGDEIKLRAAACVESHATPQQFQLQMHAAWTLRAGFSSESDALLDRDALFATTFTVSHRSDRMGTRLEGAALQTGADGKMQSVAVFPGIVQCPQDGHPFILGVDAQTTGGYPRIAKIARLDLHMLGQLRPGDTVRFLHRSEALAASELQQKHDYWRSWLEPIECVI